MRLEFEIAVIDNSRYVIGLSDENTDEHYTSIDYGLYYNRGIVMILENGDYIRSLGAAQVGDRYSIEIVRSGTVNYYKNDELRQPSPFTTPIDGNLMVDTALYDQGSIFYDVVTSFCSP